MQIEKIFIASDHAGFEFKREMSEFIRSLGYEVKDLGTTDATTSVDYPDFGFALAREVSKSDKFYGVAICGSGIGISIAANRHPAIRCALCFSLEHAKLAREHNNANIIALGARLTDLNLAKEMVKKFLNTEFSGGRHERRVKKLGESLC